MRLLASEFMLSILSKRSRSALNCSKHLAKILDRRCRCDSVDEQSMAIDDGSIDWRASRIHVSSGPWATRTFGDGVASYAVLE